MERKYAVVIDTTGEVKVIESTAERLTYTEFTKICESVKLGKIDLFKMHSNKEYDCYVNDVGVGLPKNNKATKVCNLGYTIHGNVLILHFNGIEDSELLTSDEVEYIKELFK